MLEIEKLNKSNKKHSTSSRQNPAEERISGIEDKIKEKNNKQDHNLQELWNLIIHEVEEGAKIQTKDIETYSMIL
jgi:hypothetical protein